MMTYIQFAETAKKIATSYDTIYMRGVFGSLVTEQLVAMQRLQHPTWYTADKILSRFKPLYGKKYFGFDCVCLIKGILWGWDGSLNKKYGGAQYKSNGVPDFTTLEMIEKYSNDVSTVFKNLQVGEVVWKEGHVGIYIGNNLVVECTPSFRGNVQITACNCDITGFNRRNWTKHGKLKFVDYTIEPVITYTTAKMPILQKGIKSDEVKVLQTLLNLVNNAKLEVDGSFGKDTLAALRTYQTKVGISITGVSDTATWEALAAFKVKK